MNAGISPLKDLVSFLQKKSKTTDVLKKQLIMELRDNLNVLSNGFQNNTPFDKVVDLLSNEAIQQAIRENFSFKKLRKGFIELADIKEERNKKYLGWDTEKLVDKIDEKIVELRNLKKMNRDSLEGVSNNVALMMSNLYFRMKLLADFIKSGR